MTDNAYSHFIRIEQLGPEIYERVYHVAEYEPVVQVYLGEYIFNRKLASSTRLDHKYKNSKITVHRFKVGDNTILPSDTFSEYGFYVIKVKDEEIKRYLNSSARLEFRKEHCVFHASNKDKTQLEINGDPGYQYLAIIIGKKNCKFLVKHGEARNNYRPCIRLCRAINLSWPTVSVEKNQFWIERYRKERDNNTTDWEGGREHFKRILNYSIKKRHEVKSSVFLSDVLITKKNSTSDLDMFNKE